MRKVTQEATELEAFEKFKVGGMEIHTNGSGELFVTCGSNTYRMTNNNVGDKLHIACRGVTLAAYGGCDGMIIHN